jgi:hypothetical protein
MKKNPKKLSLSRETLRNLQIESGRVLGGAEETSSLCLAGTGCECETNGCVPSHLMTEPCTLASRCAC